jgi:hypothetical protein
MSLSNGSSSCAGERRSTMITPGPLAGHQGHTPDLRLGDPLDDELEQFAGGRRR